MGILHRVGWVLVGLLAFWFWSDPPQWLACRCGYGTVKYQTAGIVYGLIVLRAVVAVALRERSPGWIVQLGLLVLVAPLIVQVVTGAGGH